MNFAEIKYIDILNGEGLRISIFVCGCRNACLGCFNQELWNFNYGEEFKNSHIEKIVTALNNKNIKYSGLSILGGDPFEYENISDLVNLCSEIKDRCPGKTIWAWSGYTYEEIIEDKKKFTLLKYLDILIDGKFEFHNKNIKLKYRGSENQRVIYLKNNI